MQNTVNLNNCDWKDKTILIVEDDFASKFYLDELFEETNAKLIHAIDGKEAVEICEKNNQIDLILMDLLLPEIDGYTATQKIRETQNNVPIIAQTAYAMTYNKEKCENAGCNAYLTKPINSDQLFNTIYEIFCAEK